MLGLSATVNRSFLISQCISQSIFRAISLIANLLLRGCGCHAVRREDYLGRALELALEPS